MQDLVDSSVVTYITKNRDSRSRAEIDQALRDSGHDTEEIEDAWRAMGAEHTATLARVPERPLRPTRNIVAACIGIISSIVAVLSLSLPWYEWKGGTINGYGHSTGTAFSFDDTLPAFAVFHWPAIVIAAFSIIACTLLLWNAYQRVISTFFFISYLFFGLELTALVFALFSADVPYAPGIIVYAMSMTATLVANVFATT